MVDGEVGIRQNVMGPEGWEKQTPRPPGTINNFCCEPPLGVFFIIYLAASSPTLDCRRGVGYCHIHPMLTTKPFLVRHKGERWPHKEVGS